MSLSAGKLSRNAAMRRVFFAVDISDEVRRAVDAHSQTLRSEFRSAPVRWVKPAAFHITLRFIAEASDELIRSATAKLQPDVTQIRSRPLSLGPATSFDDRVLVFEIRDADSVLSRLYDVNSKVLAEDGIRRERREFKPHLTIARMKPGDAPEGLIEKHKAADVTPAPFIVTSVKLIESELLPTGSRYTVIETFRLKHEDQ